MKAIELSLREIEETRKLLDRHGLINKEFVPKRINNYFYIPITNEEKVKELIPGAIIKDIDLEKKKRVLSLREIANKLGIKSIGMDRVGDIAIVHVDNIKDKSLLGELILKNYPVRSVYLKTSERKGVYRLEELELITGKDNPLSLHIENNYKLWVDIKNTYFSPRLANDRLQLSKLTRGKEVMVLFSGVGPYVVATAMHSKLSVGIELNPVAHELAKRNITINKLNNAFVIKGDAFYTKRLVNKHFLGLKAAIDQLDTRINHSKVIEIHLRDNELENNFDEIYKTIQELSSRDYRVMIHQPFIYKNKRISLSNLDESLEAYLLLEKLVSAGAMGYVAHPAPFNGGSLTETDKYLRIYWRKLRHMFIENLIEDESGDINKIINLAKKYRKNVCIDTAHLIIKGYSLREVIPIINAFDGLIHLHISNAIPGQIKPHGLPITNPDEFLFFLQNTNYFSAILEINNKDEYIPLESINSYALLTQRPVKKFDHVLMPLPKDSHSFLEQALQITKNNGFIHMYRFLNSHEQEFQELRNKARAMGYDLELVNAVRVGEHSPGIWRYRLDLKVKQL